MECPLCLVLIVIKTQTWIVNKKGKIDYKLHNNHLAPQTIPTAGYLSRTAISKIKIYSSLAATASRFSRLRFIDLYF